MEKRISVFIAYSQEDQKLCEKLKNHLKPLEHSKLINIWHIRDINAGAEWKSEIDEHLKTAEIILLLISDEFMASEYSNSIEIEQVIRRHDLGEARVIPIILRPFDWQETSIGKLQPLPPGGVPVIDWPSGLDNAFVEIARGLRKVIKELLAQQWQKEGGSLYAAQQYKEALETFDQAIQYDPKFSRAYYDKGNTLFHLHRYEEALTTYEKALHAGYDFYDIHYDIGNTLYRLQYFEDAVTAYKQSIRLNPTFGTVHYDLANALYRLKRYEDAVKEYHQAIELGFKYGFAYYDLGNALYQLGQFEQAVKAYYQAIEFGFNTDVAYFDLGNTLCQLQDYNEAAVAYEQALLLKPQNDDYKRAFAETLSKASWFPGDKYYPEHVAKAIRECYYRPGNIAGILGLPGPVHADDVKKKSPRGTEGYRRRFTNGSIYWCEYGGAQPVWRGFADVYRRHEGPAGIMGFPLTPELGAAPSVPWGTEGVFQRFEGEADYPEDILQCAVPAGLRYGATAYYNRNKKRSYLVAGSTGECYERLGGTSGKLGFPVGNAVREGVGPSMHGTKGLYKAFEGGCIYTSQRTGAHAIWDPIVALYSSLDGPKGRLGFPISNEVEETSPQGTKGVFQHFEGGLQDGEPVESGTDYSKGVLVCSSECGTYPVWGGIGICYQHLGGIHSALGFPTSSEEIAGESPQGTTGFYQRFEGGIIFYCEGCGGVPVVGIMQALYDELKGTEGRFGFPKLPEKKATHNPQILLQEFEGGVICVGGF